MSNWISRPLRERVKHQPQVESSWMLRLTLLGTVVALLWMNRGFIKPIAMAALFAATLYPFSLKLEKRIASAGARALLLTVSFALIFLLPIGIVAFLAADAGLKRIKDLPEDWMSRLEVNALFDRLDEFVRIPIDRADLVRVIEQGAASVGKTALSTLQNLVSDLPKLTVDNIVVVLALYFFLFESAAVLGWLRKFSPLSKEKTAILFKSVGDLSSSVVFAALMAGLVQSLIFGVFLVALSVPGTLLIAMTAFVLSFIPVVGTLPVSIYLIGSAAIQGNWPHVIAFSVASAIVSLSDNVVRPYVISGSAKLHPLIGFIAAFGALETIGFYGLFLGPVVAGAVFTIVELVLDDRTA